MAICIIATLAVTSWFSSDQKQRTVAVFETITEDNKAALLGRMADYRQALIGAAGFIAASDDVTVEDWRKYVKTLSISESLPGIGGLGFILPVEKANMPEFLAELSLEGQPDFRVHPDTNFDTAFVIKYIEPMAENLAAVGLDIAFEDGRRQAAVRARDTKSPQLTQRILLVQDDTKKPGFLLLYPIFDDDEKTFIGWSYLPFIGDKALHSLTPGQTRKFWLTVYDGPESSEDNLIYDERSDQLIKSAFTRSVVVSGMGREWLLVWSSTPAFEAEEAQITAWLALALGLIVAVLLGTLTSTLLQRERAVQLLVKQKTSELKARELQTSSIVDNAVDAILLLDDQQRVVTANKAAGELFGVNELELIGKPLETIVGKIDIFKHEQSEWIKAKTSLSRSLLLDARFSSWETIDGTLQSVAILQDVTKAEENREMLREAEARWNTVLVGAEIGVFEVDLRTGKSTVSGMWKTLMGVPDGTSDIDTQKLFLERIHPEDLIGLKAADDACISGKAARSVAQYRMRFGDDEWRWMRSDAVVAERDEDGTAIRLLGAQTDITRLRHAQEKLEHSRQQFKSVVDNAPVGMAICAANGDFLGLNGALCDLTGFGKDYLQTKKLRDVVVREDFLKLLSNVQDLQARNQNSLKSECRILTNGGEPKWGLVGVAWTFNEELNEDMYILQVQDITELKNVEKMKTQFVSTVSHELRTPLTSIKGALSLLDGQYGEDMPSPASRLIKIAQQNGDRLIELVNDILDMEKISSGQSDFSYVHQDVSELVRLTAEQLQPFAHQHHATIKTHFPKIAPAVNVDPRRLQQVVSNLLSNAAKYSNNGSVIDVFVERQDGQIRVMICNTGPGIPASFTSKIFMPFQQADSSDTRSNGGTGLGLNISKQIIDRMGGTIGFDSVIDGETRFWFMLPEVAHDVRNEGAGQSPTAESRRPIEILHLEDDEDFAEITRKSFGNFAQVTSVGTLTAAQEKVRQSRYDLVIIDWELPDGSGAELIECIAQNQDAIPIFGLSAYEGAIKSDLIVADFIKSRSDLKDVVAKAIKSVELYRQAG
ncbi:CHASE domain-containing protein [Litoreibacter halocynthiae]|uniref:CHASE domain-containing protein n=1 Tax=Litoreibacter halocynthiae TaxID=1242689 RepID=UPI002492BD09|nr:CHASE domain-containing protein [Litoreibacter halocynthiae]